MVFLVVLQVSAPYSRTDFTFMLNSRILVVKDSSLEAHTFSSWMKAAFALPILALTSAFVPPPPPPPLQVDEGIQVGEGLHFSWMTIPLEKVRRACLEIS